MEEETPRGINEVSRRKLLKQAGVGAAVVWAAPVVTTLGGHAFAQSYGQCPDCAPATLPEACFEQPACGSEESGNPCGCVTRPSSGCFCHSCIICDHPNVTACSSDADCPPGWACGLSCCSADENDTRCHPMCGTSNPDPCVGSATAAGFAVRATSMPV